MSQTQLFNEEEGELLQNDFKPGLTIEERIKIYKTYIEAGKGYCQCKGHQQRPYEDCTHIKTLRLHNLEKIDSIIMEHISEKRDDRDKSNTGLEGAIDHHNEHRGETLHKLMDIVITIARQKGIVSSDDLHTVTNEAYRDDRIVGTVFAILLRTHVLEEVDRKPTCRKVAHARKISIYKLTEKNTFNDPDKPTFVSTGKIENEIGTRTFVRTVRTYRVVE